VLQAVTLHWIPTGKRPLYTVPGFPETFAVAAAVTVAVVSPSTRPKKYGSCRDTAIERVVLLESTVREVMRSV